jgi:hypothetical protein
MEGVYSNLITRKPIGIDYYILAQVSNKNYRTIGK